MDYLDLTILLARDGYTTKWGEAERIIRNHLIESQMTRTDWAPRYSTDTYNPVYCDDRVPERMLGGFAGWSAFDSFFGMTECFTEQWQWLKTDEADPAIYFHHPRLFQNCCGPAGLRALYLAWSQACTVDAHGLQVNLLMSRSLPEGTVAVAENVDGQIEVRVTPHQSLPIRVRIPHWTNSAAIAVQVQGKPVVASQADGWVALEDVTAEAPVVFTFPCSSSQETYEVKHGGYAHDRYTITMKGDAAVSIEKTAGIAPDDLHKISVLADAYPLYQRDAKSVYAAEKTPITSRATINWFE